MSDNVQMFLIGAVALVVIVGIVVFLLRGRFRSGNLKVSRDGIEGGVKTHGPPATKVVGVKIKGENINVTAKDGGQIEQVEAEGCGHNVTSSNS